MTARLGVRRKINKSTRKSKTTRNSACRKSLVKCGKCCHTARNHFRLRYHLAKYHRTNPRHFNKLSTLNLSVKHRGNRRFRRRKMGVSSECRKQVKPPPIQVGRDLKDTNLEEPQAVRNEVANRGSEATKIKKPRRVFTMKPKAIDPPVTSCTRQLRSSRISGGCGALLAKAKELKSRRESLQSVNETLKSRSKAVKPKKDNTKSENKKTMEPKSRHAAYEREKPQATGVKANLREKNKKLNAPTVRMKSEIKISTSEDQKPKEAPNGQTAIPESQGATSISESTKPKDELITWPQQKTQLKCKKNVKRRHKKKTNREHRDLMPVPCHLCNYVGRDSYNLRRHMQSKHEPKPPKVPKIHQCEQCDYKNKYRFLVKRHSMIHSLEGGHRGDKSIGFRCDKCEYVSSSACNLKRHKFSRHEKVKEAKLQCSLCEHREPDRLALFGHFREAHGVIIETEKLEFPDFESFVEFKMDTEKATFSRFVRQQTRTGKNKHVIFKCHRDGMFKSKSRGERKRALKTTGSNKINSACPASIRMTIDPSGKVSVIFTKTHVGHSNEVCRLTLTKEEKILIGEMLESKRTFQEILGEIRNGLESDRLERIHLLSRKDLQNIEKWYKNREVEESPRLPIDINIQAWVDKVKDTSVVRLYKKPATVLPKPFKCLEYDDFVLILANDFQMAMLRHYGSDCICIDNDYDNSQVKLTSLMVVDDNRQGFPCAFMLSSKMDKAIMKVFLDVVKKESGCPMVPSILVFDIPDYRRTEWSAVMDLPESAKVLYSPWSINDDLNRNSLKVKSENKRTEVLGRVQDLISENNVNAISQSLENTVKFLEETEGTELFGKYFKSKFADTAHRWSQGYRDRLPTASMDGLEEVHEVVKFVYSEGLMNNNLEDCINVLMTCCRDQLQNRIVLHKQNDDLVNLISKRHEAANVMKTQPADSGVYQIMENDLQCRCGLRCPKCNICIHTYRCTCNDSILGWTICQHIHFCVMSNPEGAGPGLPVTTAHFDPLEEKRKLLLEFENMCDDIAADEEAVGVTTMVGVPVIEEIPEEELKRSIQTQGFSQDGVVEGSCERQEQESDFEELSKSPAPQDQVIQPSPSQEQQQEVPQPQPNQVGDPSQSQDHQVQQPLQSHQHHTHTPPPQLENEAEELHLEQPSHEQPQLEDAKSKLQSRFQSICQQMSSGVDLSLIEQALASIESAISSKKSRTE